REKDTETLVPGGENGNNSAPVLGHPVTATGITRTTENSADTPITSAWVSGCLFGRVKLTGSYVYAAPDVFGGSVDADTGSFVSFQILRFFSGVADTINPNVDGHAWRGQARAEAEIIPGLSVMGGWRETSSKLTGMALISTLYQNTVTFAGQSTGDILRLLEVENGIDRSDRVFDATLLGRYGPLSFNGGWSQLHQDVTLTQDAAEIVVPGGQSGRFERTVNTYGGGATFSMAGLTLTGDYRRDDANRPIFRTDYTDRDRFKLRALYAFKNLGKVGGSWREIKAPNNTPSRSYNADVRELVADLEITPIKELTLHGSGGEFKTTRKILELAPQNFTTFTGRQDEIGHTWEGGATFAMAPVTVDGSYIYLTNDGTLPFTLRRIRTRSEFSFTKNLSAALEWWLDTYREANTPLANYNANRYYVGLHWKP